MKYSYHWLKELSGTKKSAEQLSKLLMTHAFEVEGIEKFEHGLEGVVAGKVVSLEKHPNADKLRVARVQLGKRDTREIVCGAPNIAQGQMVAVAVPGTKLPGGIEISEVKLRGVTSQGMICSAKELGLGDDHSGIMVLPDDTPVGALMAKYFGFDDTLIEVKVLPDRGSDALAYQGLAREIAALDGHAPRFAEKQLKPIRVPSYNRAPKVIIEDKQDCLRYLGLSFKDVTIGTSPLWLQSKLILSGLRPINNIVDVTNYLMLLTGQPLHAFDADQLSGAITARRAKKGEKLELLTGETKRLTRDDLVIADNKNALALAGVMGGVKSGVTDKTRNLFMEIANFKSGLIRQTRTRHNLATDASYRFERNLDANLPAEVAREAIALVTELTGGKLSGMRDVYPKKITSWKISLSLERVKSVLGTEVPMFEVVQHLALLGLKVKKVAAKEQIEVSIPTRRPDLRDEWDLIEEIGRMRGYDKIRPAAPLVPLAAKPLNEGKRFERAVKTYLAHAGFDEVMTYSFYGEKDAERAGLPLERHLEVENPLSPELRLLRLSHLPLLLRKAKENIRSYDAFDLFEWGSVFAKQKSGEPAEVKSLEWLTVTAEKSGRGEVFFGMKGRVEAFFESLHLQEEEIVFESPERYAEVPVLSLLHPTRSAVFVHAGKPIGVIGEIHPKVLKAYGLEPRVAVAGFVVDALRQLQKKEREFTPLQKFPYAVRDISLTFPRTVSVGQVEKLLREAGSLLLQRFELFDIYEQDGEKSLAFHLSFGASDRTLSSAEMDAAFDRIVALAAERFQARLRT